MRVVGNLEKRWYQEAIYILALAFAANGLVILGFPGLNFVGAALLLYLLPGLALFAWAVPHGKSDWVERIALSAGLSLALSVIAGLLVHYLPGPLTRWQVLLTQDLFICVFLLLCWIRNARNRPLQGAAEGTPFQIVTARILDRASRSVLSPLGLIFLGLLILAVFYRFTWLGYSEFQGDEALVTWGAARAISGEDDILFLHGKSPAEILLPTSLWVLDGRMNEATARFPFALASLIGAVGAYLVGKRFFGRDAGFIAFFLFAINGYFIGFGRVVQYQSLVLAMSILAVFSAHRALEDRLDAYQIFSALLMGAGLLSHYDAILTLPAVALLWFGRLLQSKKVGPHRRWFMGTAALVLLVSIAAAFYLPLFRDLHFAQMFSYLSGTRVGTNLFNNHVRFLLLSGTLYNSSYYTAGLVFALLGVWWWTLRWLPGRRYTASLLMLLVISTALLPDFWLVGQVNLAIVPFSLALLLAWLSPVNDWGRRAIWLWFAVTALFYVFVLTLPLSHVYAIMPPWILLVAYGSKQLLSGIGRFCRVRPACFVWLKSSIPILVLILFILAYYPYLIFVRHIPEFTQAYSTSPLPLYWRPYVRLPQVGLFGFPHRSGWKAIGHLYDTGILAGDFRGNEEEWVMLWYTHFAPYSCQPDARYYFLATNPWDAGQVPLELIDAEYELIGAVSVEGESRLQIYQHRPAEVLDMPDRTMGDVAAMSVSNIEEMYDKDSGPGRFVQNTTPQHDLQADFGNEITLLGYDLDSTTVAAGSRMGLTLYWQAKQPVSQNYHVFVQVGDEKLWGQADSEPVCGRLPTSLWRPGKVIIDRYRLDIDPESPPGKNRVYVGLYSPETGRRLEPSAGNDSTNRLILTELGVW